MATSSRVGIVGAGPGGLMAAMLLSKRGYQVTVYEAQAQIGGRCGEFCLGDYRFDIGPTFLMYPELLQECFLEAGADLHQEVDMMPLDPMYELFYGDGKKVSMHQDPDAMGNELESHFPGSREKYLNFRKQEKSRFEKLRPVLQQEFSRKRDYFDFDRIKALFHLGLGKSVHKRLNEVFVDPDLTLSFTFQSKYLGMSAFECPSLFSIIPHLEHEYGVHHVMGGLNQINQAMARVAKKHGAKIICNRPVKEVVVKNGKARGVLLDDGMVLDFDHLILNADFAYSVQNLLDDRFLKTYKRQKIENLKYSCSTFMLYLGVKRRFDLPFHSIVFAKNYRKNIDEIFNQGKLSKDLSFYVRNASLLDPSLAPEGHSALYVLVPVPNLKQCSDWGQQKSNLRERILDQLSERLGIDNIRPDIEEELIYTPQDWQQQLNVQYGATFNLSHSWDQLAMFRPKNAFNDLESLYLVGGATHPGSGLPTIYESGRIATKLILRNEGKQYAEN